ncbi:MAG: 30S ribosomal protein S20 [Candidatus Tectomicrobia bacterium]|nr:30S ribosomal protein S20 [Candidatus Tectomicrobia bacterium]
MARTKSVLKAARQNRKRRARNQILRTRYRTIVKKVHAALEEGDPKASQEALAAAIQTIDRTASKGVIHPRTASRKIARLSRRAHALQQKASSS